MPGLLGASLITKVGNSFCFFRRHGQTTHVRRPGGVPRPPLCKHGSHHIIGCSYTAAQTTHESHWSDPGSWILLQATRAPWVGGVNGGLCWEVGGGSVKPRGPGCRSPHLRGRRGLWKVRGYHWLLKLPLIRPHLHGHAIGQVNRRSHPVARQVMRCLERE